MSIRENHQEKLYAQNYMIPANAQSLTKLRSDLLKLESTISTRVNLAHLNHITI